MQTQLSFFHLITDFKLSLLPKINMAQAAQRSDQKLLNSIKYRLGHFCPPNVFSDLFFMFQFKEDLQTS